jgi:DNA-binding response OmpR family regulator
MKKMDTVLVVEDSRAMQRTLQRLLEADSLNVQIASDGIAGLECFRKQQPSAVLLDLKLPGLSGKELCR